MNRGHHPLLQLHPGGRDCPLLQLPLTRPHGEYPLDTARRHSYSEHYEPRPQDTLPRDSLPRPLDVANLTQPPVMTPLHPLPVKIKSEADMIPPELKRETEEPMSPTHLNHLSEHELTYQSLQHRSRSHETMPHPHNGITPSSEAMSHPHDDRSQHHDDRSQLHDGRSQPHDGMSQPLEDRSHPQDSRSQPHEDGSHPHDGRPQTHDDRSQPHGGRSQPQDGRSQPYNNMSHHEKMPQPKENLPKAQDNQDLTPKQEILTSRIILEFDGNDHVLCRVCGDKASGFHYGVHSCEGCKGFFRRSIQQKIQYRPCTKNQQCAILRINRNRCQYCRLKKCIAAGMSRDAVRFGRVPKREKAKILAAMQSSRMKTMEHRVMAEMDNDSKIIETIVRAHFDTCDYTASKIEPFIAKAKANQNFVQCGGLTCPMKGRPEQFFLEQFSERFMDHVRQVCTFAKSIPGFKCLHHDDQVSLLKSCVFEVLLVRLSGLFDNQSLVCLNGDVIKRDTISAMPAGNARFLMDSVFELAQRINRFGLSDAEIGLFCAVVIITADRPGLRNPELVQKMQSKLKVVLQNSLNPQQPDRQSIFTELVNIIHDLRTLNTLHTEKFLQQCRVTDSQVSSNNRLVATPSTLQQHLLYGVEPAWEDVHGTDRDSSGSRSPQSSDSHTTTSYNFEDLRRSPMGSVSSSESLGSNEVAKLSVQDLKIHGVGSVLLNALTSGPLAPIGHASRKRDISRCGDGNGMRGEEAGGPVVVDRVQLDTKCPFKARKLDSPSDSGIDSPKAQGSHSTNTSVCSSPRSSMEEKVKEVEEEKSDSLEESHPLLKRALQQPPQPFNMGGVTGFQDEVYKPHKKFRHGGRKDSDEPTSTQETAKSPSPGPSHAQSHSILASQLAAPPTYTQPGSVPPAHQSILACSLNRPVSITMAKEESKRNDILANLILNEGGRPQSLLMCAPPAHNIPAQESARWRGQPSNPVPQTATPRHIPVPVAPTQPTSSLHPSQATPSSTRPAQAHPSPRPSEPAKNSSQLRMALAGLPTTADSPQPLNLSTRTPPPHDIPAEA